MAAILIIDPSATTRETLRIVLAGEHAVSLASSWDTVVPGTAAELVIFGAPSGPRDDAASATLRARIAPHAPLLLLNTPDEIDPRTLAPLGHRVEFMTQPFDPPMLRARIRTLLRPLPRAVPSDATAAAHRRWLEPPLLTPAAAALARNAVLSDVPVLLVGERGAGATDVARAIHFFAGGGAIVARAARELGTQPLLATDPRREASSAVVLEDVHLLPADAQRALAAELRDASASRIAARLFATTDVDLEVRVSEGRFAADLAFALAVMPIVLPPLRARLADLPAIVDVLLPPLVARARLEPVTLTRAALERLQQYLWFGNVAELEAVLARTLAVHRPRVVEPDMLLFNPADAVRADVPSATGRSAAATPTGTGDAPSAGGSSDPSQMLSSAAAPSAAATSPARARVLPLERRRADESLPDAARADAPAIVPSPRLVSAPRPPTEAAVGETEGLTATAPSLEVLLGELAHELRNPMVTIKTFAQHLDRVLDDPEVRTRFATLAGDAITRMDTLLETLLDFSRFRAPRPQAIDLTALLARALEERADDLARKHARIEPTPPHGEPRTVDADEAQMLFACRSLVDGLVQDLVARTSVRIASRADGGVELRVHAERAVAARLASWVAGAEHDADTAPPLSLALAAALVRRNRGRLDVRPDDGETVITITIAARGGVHG